MNELQIFESKEFGQVRTIEIEGKPYFVASDIAKALGYAIPSKAVNTHCKGVSKMEVPSNGGMQEMLIIPEGDVYRLIIKSQLPNAAKFESWVFDEVLPSIRKHGAYMTPEKIEEVLLNPDTIIKIATELKTEREKRMALEVKIESDKPLTIFANAVTTSDKDILIGELAKLIKQNNVAMGEKRLFTWMRDNGYLIKRKGTDWNMPTQRSMEMGLFRVKETAIAHSDGHTSVSKTTKVTGKGQVYFINVFLQKQVEFV